MLALYSARTSNTLERFGVPPNKFWTGAAGSCFVTGLVRRKLRDFAPPGQRRWIAPYVTGHITFPIADAGPVSPNQTRETFRAVVAAGDRCCHAGASNHYRTEFRFLLAIPAGALAVTNRPWISRFVLGNPFARAVHFSAMAIISGAAGSWLRDLVHWWPMMPYNRRRDRTNRWTRAAVACFAMLD